MKKIIFVFLITLLTLPVNAKCVDTTKLGITANAPLEQYQYEFAKKTIARLQKEMPKHYKDGYGPFRAAVYDDKGNLIAETQNSVIHCCDCTNHAEMNVIRATQKALNSYDLSKYNLSVYVTAEPCIMCAGGIMWSGIKNIYFSVYSKDVEDITGFDEGYKPNWIDQFKNRGINVYGGIDQELGKQMLRKYVKEGNTVYKPER